MEKVWVIEPCEISQIDNTSPRLRITGKTYQTSLVIFKDGVQVDFALYDLDVLKDLSQKDELPVDYSLGYNVLLDKDGLTKDLKQPTFACPKIPKPSKEEFELAIRVFFFEIFKQARALYRNDLFHAKIRDVYINKNLLKMIEWSEKAKNGLDYNTNCAGKRMQSWVDEKTWNSLFKTFAHFERKDSFNALIATIDLFSKLAKETADLFEYSYLNDVDENIMGFVEKLKTNI